MNKRDLLRAIDNRLLNMKTPSKISRKSYGSGADLFQDQDTCLSVAGAQEITPTSDLSTYNIASSFPTSESETTLLETAGDSTLDMQVVVETDPVSAGAVLNDAVHEDGGEDDVMDELPRFGPEPKPKTKQQLKFENKDRREHGDEYKNYKGVVVPKKKPKLIECKCQFPSCRTLTEEETSSIHEAYWELGNYSRQRDFINNCIKSVPVKRHSTGAAKPRENSYEYYFRVPRGEDNREDTDIRVCRAKFLGTLDIGKKTLVCTKKNETNGFSKKDQRGKHAPKHKLSEQQHSAVVEHISSFPRVESHYCRQSSSFEYLDQKLTIRLMHKLYKLVHDTRLHVGYETYRRVFKKDFHLSFHKPKKDQCSTCAAFKNLTDEQKSLGREEYARHLQNKELAQKEKNAHKEEALRNDSFKSFSFDLQSVLYTPCSEVSSFYYSRKLNSYNFTIYDQATRDGVCYFWDETEGERGTCEIGTALWTHLLTLPANVKKVSFFSDCCGGQNRNRFIAALLLHAARVLHFEQIDHCFLESGHTHMEVDSMHSCIEQAKRGREVYCPSEWIPIIRSARGFSKTKGANPLTIKPYSVKRPGLEANKRSSGTMLSGSVRADNNSSGQHTPCVGPPGQQQQQQQSARR
ncbi:hypothetical protein FOCC_FOCC014154 [Frankliniella occidentalis]|nr:hypothetical protein FOCC_FOCC014154 [Frankliniella occidentalis]